MAFITLDRKAFFHNLDLVSAQAGGRDRVALVLKDNAYGHGLLPMARMAADFGIARAVVRTVAEAEAVAEFFPYILVLAEIPERVLPFRFTVNTPEDLAAFPAGSRIELKVDTGMHRNGIAPDGLEAAFAAAAERKLKLEGVFTHHRSADELTGEYFWQRKRFEALRRTARTLAQKYGFGPLRFHSANSAALFRAARCGDDMVRIGIAAYGCLEMARTLPQPELRPVLSLWGEQIASRTLHAGQRLGYGGTFEAAEETTVSTYDLGYADGLLRGASNRSFTAPSGARLLGRVSMDNCSFDTAESPLCVFDDARRYAAAAGTIPYEVLVALSEKIPRKVVNDED